MALALLAVGGCDEQPPPGILPDSTYVAVMARLGVVLEAENAAPGGRPSFEPDSAREAILAAYGISAEDLSRYAQRYGGDPDRMHEIWAAVADAAQALRTSWTTEDGVLELPADVREAPVPDDVGDEGGAADPGTAPDSVAAPGVDDSDGGSFRGGVSGVEAGNAVAEARP